MDTQTMNIIAVIVGPIIAVAITLWYHNRKQKYDAKERLFITLMAHRKSFPPTYEWVGALNVIDVVFADHPKVVSLWHEYYDLLHSDWEKYLQQRDHKYLELLSEMARSLGYKKIQQTDIDKYYSPRAHGEQYEINAKTQKEFLRVLENTSSLMVQQKTDDKNEENPKNP